MRKEISPKIIALTFGVLVISFLAGFYVVAWTEPSQTPPGGNVPAPINVSTTTQTKTGSLIVGGAALEAYNNAFLSTLGGSVGIGTPSPGYKLSVFDSTSNTWVQVKGQSVSGAFSGLRLGSDEATDKEYILQHRSNNDFWIEYNDGINPYYTRMVIDSSGNVGIGTPAPGAKLEVAGQVKITGGSPGANKVLTSDASGLASWQTAAGGGAGFPKTEVFNGTIVSNVWTDLNLSSVVGTGPALVFLRVYNPNVSIILHVRVRRNGEVYPYSFAGAAGQEYAAGAGAAEIYPGGFVYLMVPTDTAGIIEIYNSNPWGWILPLSVTLESYIP